jgi:hypothetical protein
VTPDILLGGYQHIGGTYCLHFHPYKNSYQKWPFLAESFLRLNCAEAIKALIYNDSLVKYESAFLLTRNKCPFFIWDSLKTNSTKVIALVVCDISLYFNSIVTCKLVLCRKQKYNYSCLLLESDFKNEKM